MSFHSIYERLLESQNYSSRKQWLSVAVVGEKDRLQSGMKKLLGDDRNVLFLDFDGDYMTRYTCQNSNCSFKMGNFYYIM